MGGEKGVEREREGDKEGQGEERGGERGEGEWGIDNVQKRRGVREREREEERGVKRRCGGGGVP